MVCSWVWVSAIWCYYFHTLHTHLSGLDNNIFPLFFLPSMPNIISNASSGKLLEWVEWPRFFREALFLRSTFYIRFETTILCTKKTKVLLLFFKMTTLPFYIGIIIWARRAHNKTVVASQGAPTSSWFMRRKL